MSAVVTNIFTWSPFLSYAVYESNVTPVASVDSLFVATESLEFVNSAVAAIAGRAGTIPTSIAKLNIAATNLVHFTFILLSPFLIFLLQFLITQNNCLF